MSCGGALQIKDGNDLTANLQFLLDDSEKRQTMGRNGMRFIMENSGATKMHMEVIRKLVKGEE